MSIERRKVYLDALRIIAMLLVIFNHLPGYTVYQVASGVKGWLYTCITMFTRINVPLFFMISGALLLGKQEPLSSVWLKRILRMVVVLVLFSALTYSVANYPDIQFDAKEFVQKLLGSSIATPYWFMYTYIGFLILLPYLRKMADGFTQKDFFYLLTLRLVLLGFIPILRYVCNEWLSFSFRISNDLKILIATERIFFYPLVGYYLDKVLDITTIKPKHLWGILGAFVFSLVVPSMITIHQGRNGTFTQDYVQLFDYIIAICVFVGFKYFFVKRQKDQPTAVEKCICAVAPLTFAIYLLDPFWKKLFYADALLYLQPHMPKIIFSLCWCAFSAILGGIVAFILRLIPGVKKWL